MHSEEGTTGTVSKTNPGNTELSLLVGNLHHESIDSDLNTQHHRKHLMS